MVSTASLAAIIFTLLLSLFLPAALAIYFYRKYRFSLKALFLGAGVLLLFQFILRIPLLSYLSGQPWFRDLSTGFFFSAVIIGGLTAGLFEECGRYLSFRIVLKHELSWKNGFAYGLGHGGIESIVTVGFAYINNLVFSLMINSGVFEHIVAPQLGADAAVIREQLVALPPSLYLAAGAERLLTLLIHIALSLLVLYAVKSKKPLFLLAAILLHTGLNAGALFLQESGAGIWGAELFIFAAALAALYLIIRIRTPLAALSERGEESKPR
ncbi:MAG TPA: YhfC family intramembrane metalloprotease [Firmicutes bacterium]|jgi:uncharacterized membrane protein YhfC|nr:YhfC family intramembrane metalloprotease [Bacillota bacterium]